MYISHILTIHSCPLLPSLSYPKVLEGIILPYDVKQYQLYHAWSNSSNRKVKEMCITPHETQRNDPLTGVCELGGSGCGEEAELGLGNEATKWRK